MAEAVMLSAIESLDCWLLKKGGILEENLEKLCSLIVGMSDLGEEKKEIVHSLLLKFVMVEERKTCSFEEHEDKKKLYNLLDLNKEKMYCLLVGMADFLEDYKVRLYPWLFGVSFPTSPFSFVAEIVDLWEANEGELNKEELHSFLFQMRNEDNIYLQKHMRRMRDEVEGLCKDKQPKLNKNKLHKSQILMKNVNSLANRNIHDPIHSKKAFDRKMSQMHNEKVYSMKNMRKMSCEVAGLWKDKQPKLNKEKLYTWLANKVDLYEPNYLFRHLLDTVHHYDTLYYYKATREGVEGAKREFREILDMITHKKLGDESSLRYFISDVVDMAHSALFLIQLMDSDPFALFLVLSARLQTYHGWLGEKFKPIVNGLQEIKVSMLGFRVERLHNIREIEGRENVVGLEDDIKLLLYSEGNTKIITVITGMAGIGKTTLARQVYNHKTITQQFERRAWVCLSKIFSRKEMLVSLIRQIVDSSQLAALEKIESMDYKSLKQVLRQQWLGMRYFIVLDDVSFKTTHLEYVKKALPKDKQGSRLLLTSRAVSRVYDAIYHQMKSMDDDKSWTLLLKTLSIEGSDEEFPKPLVKKARQILRKCGGLPLAIKEVGRNWAKKRQSGSEWKELINESIDLTETLGVLESTYHDWDPKLQSRFLHLAFFKEGASIRAKRLVHIWAVMGVVSYFLQQYSPTEWFIVEGKYQGDLQELHRESVIDINMDIKGIIKTCCVHPVFHMLSIRLAEDELNFEILRKDRNNRPTYHRAIYCSRENLMNYSSNQDKHLVSLFFYGGGYFNASPSYWNHFEQLKTLDVEDFGLKILPDVIGMLSDLRYLGLRNNYIQELPHSLTRLKKLEVLDIALNFMVEVEDIIWEMESLRHLYMSDISCQRPLRINTLNSLETWTYISIYNWAYEVSTLEMKSLRILGIQNVDENTDVSNLFASLAHLKNLKFLILKGFRFKSMPSLDGIGILWHVDELKLDGLIIGLPCFPRYMKHLSLVNSCLREDPMPILEKLHNLSYLKLQNAYIGQQMVISWIGFHGLEFLVLEELWHLTNVQIEKGGMNWLIHLEINSCPNLETLPEDYCPQRYGDMVFKMKTTRKNETKIRESRFVSKIRKVDTQP